MGQVTQTIEELRVVLDQQDKGNQATVVGWDDSKFPFTGNNIDVASGRIDYSYPNGTISFQNNARYPNEAVSMLDQLSHKWKEGSEIRPHFHWLQQSANVPNWLMAYKIYDNNASATVDTDYTNHTFVTSTPVFTYTSGTLAQISVFPPIDMTGYTLSDMVHYVFWRDTSNASGEFAGADPSSSAEHVLEFDIHYQTDQERGSRQEFIK